MTTDLDIDLAPRVLARDLCMELGEVESELAPLNRQREQLRASLAAVLERCDGRRVDVAGFGTARVTDGSMVKRWNEDRLATLCAWLRGTDREEVAEMIESCREDAVRSGGLRVERERQ